MQPWSPNGTSNLRLESDGIRNLLGTRIPLVSLRLVLAVAQYRSFRQAAIGLGVSQSSISERIRTLEDNLGILLFDRSTRGVTPTEAGRFFAAEDEIAMRTLDRAVRTAGMHARGEQGELRIGVYALIVGGLLNTLLERFHKLHPQVVLRISGAASRSRWMSVS